MDSVNEMAADSSPLLISPAPELNSTDMIFTLTGSASALRRSATWRAASSFIGPAAMGAQHTGVDMSIVGSAFGTIPWCHAN